VLIIVKISTVPAVIIEKKIFVIVDFILKNNMKNNNKYAFGVYKPNKNCKPVTYNGTEYLSKAQCMALEGIDRKTLDEYLKNQNNND
jgi:hypothetical protein